MTTPRSPGLRVVATIEARMGSTRLPGKVMSPVLGRPLLSLLIERLQRVRRLDGIVLATTVAAADDALEALARQMRIECFRGSEDDVLDRVLNAARQATADVIVEITGDCPLIDPAIVDRVIDVYLADDRLDYVSNGLTGTFPNGQDVQVFSTSTLDEVSRLTADPADREHVSLYIYEHPERYALKDVPSGLPASSGELRLSVDTAEDLALVRAVFEGLHPTNPAFSLDDILAFFDRRPDLRDLNRHVVQRPARVGGSAAP